MATNEPPIISSSPSWYPRLQNTTLLTADEDDYGYCHTPMGISHGLLDVDGAGHYLFSS
jgi:hypothetical protein